MDNGNDEARALKRLHHLAQTGLLVELREGVGLTQADVARALGVDRSRVSRWERCKGRPRPRRAVALLELLEAM